MAIQSYHSSHSERYRFIKHSQVIIDNDEFIGFELEVEKPNSSSSQRDDFTDTLADKYPNLFFENDGSLRDGFEIISQPHTFDAIVNNLKLKDLLKDLRDNGYVSHDSARCGLHFHLSRPSQTVIKRLNYLVNVRFKDDLVRLSRRNDFTYCAFRTYSGNRRVALNLGNRNTIEFRFFRGTLKYDTFIESMSIVLKLLKLAKTNSLWVTSERVTKLKYNITILSVLTKYGANQLTLAGGNPYVQQSTSRQMD